jgi:Undecaprenyl-phosphate galactose phosphotransferase WbaP
MASLIDSEPVEDTASSAELESKRYHRLSAVDRHSAETLKSFWKANATSDAVATRLANRSSFQDINTSIPLAIADVLSVGLCLVAGLLATNLVLGQVQQQRLDIAGSLFLSLLVLPIAHLAGLYPGQGLGSIVEFRQLARSLMATFIVFAGIGWFQFPEARLPYLAAVFLGFVASLPVAMVVRSLARRLACRCPWWGAPVLIVAEPSRGVDLAKRMLNEVEQGLKPVGLLLNPEHYWSFEKLGIECGVPCFDIRQTSEVAEKLGATWVVVSPCANRETTPALDSALASIPNRIMLSSSQLDMGIWDEIFCVGSHTGLRFGGAQSSSLKLSFKRFIDVVLTLGVMIAGFPVLVAICSLVRLSSRGPIFYSQKRIGRGGKEFNAWKFRSMQQNADKVLEQYLAENPAARREWDETHKLANDPRVTQIGKFLRATSFDELPQLWNVLVGEMSLVGPRPIIDSPRYDAAYIHEYTDEFEAYKTVRPGLTGLWQVRCRNNGVYELRIYWDMYYIRNWCIWLDLYLIMRTVKTVVFREGAS